MGAQNVINKYVDHFNQGGNQRTAVEVSDMLREFGESYTEAKIQALKERVESLQKEAESKADLESMSWDEAQEEAYSKVLNLVTNLEVEN